VEYFLEKSSWNPERMQALRESIELGGMQHPVPVLLEGGVLKFYSGGMRIHTGLLDGYSHIHAWVCATREGCEMLKVHQAKDEENYFPEHLIDRWW